MSRKSVTEAWAEMPHGTYAHSLNDGERQLVTVAVPLAERLPCFVLVLRMVNRSGAPELADFTVEFFVPPSDHHLETDPSTCKPFERWVEAKSSVGVDERLPPGGLTMRQLKALRVGDLYSRARRLLAAEAAADAALPDDERVFVDAPGWAALATSRPGRRGRGDLHYAQLAAEYVKAAANSPTPVADIAQARHLSAQTVSNQLAEARRRKLLTTVARGVPGGALTPKSIALLGESQ